MKWIPRVCYGISIGCSGFNFERGSWPGRGFWIGWAALNGILIALTFTEVNPWDLARRLTSKLLRPSQPQSSSQPQALNPPSISLSLLGGPTANLSLRSVKVDQPIIGYRTWTWDGRELLPAAYGPHYNHLSTAWKTSMLAHCAEGGNHSAPANGCTCGLHAWLTPKAGSWPGTASISGIVLASGRILRHTQENGFRAEKMRILALARPPMREVRMEYCPAVPVTGVSGYFLGYVSTPAVAGLGTPYHNWLTEDRSLDLPTGKHAFKAKIKCQLCGCGPEREFTTIDHMADLKQLEAIAAKYGVPVVPQEHLASYAAEFGLVATEVQAVG